MCMRVAVWDGFGEVEKLADFADFFLKAFAGEFSAHFQFHNFGSFSVCCSRMLSREICCFHSVVTLSEVEGSLLSCGLLAERTTEILCLAQNDRLFVFICVHSQFTLSCKPPRLFQQIPSIFLPFLS